MGKKLTLSKKQLEELKGFEEVVDLLVGDETQIVKPRQSQNEDYEIFNYLEKEVQRLTKIDDFFRHQYNVIQQYSQTKTILSEEQVDLDKVKQHFIVKIGEEDSHFMNNMDKMFAGVFK